jgi:hypothetical protein
MNYIHCNPVEAGIVHKPEDYLDSNARDYFHPGRCDLLDLVFLQTFDRKEDQWSIPANLFLNFT